MKPGMSKRGSGAMGAPPAGLTAASLMAAKQAGAPPPGADGKPMSYKPGAAVVATASQPATSPAVGPVVAARSRRATSLVAQARAARRRSRQVTSPASGPAAAAARSPRNQATWTSICRKSPRTNPCPCRRSHPSSRPSPRPPECPSRSGSDNGRPRWPRRPRPSRALPTTVLWSVDSPPPRTRPPGPTTSRPRSLDPRSRIGPGTSPRYEGWWCGEAFFGALGFVCCLLQRACMLVPFLVALAGRVDGNWIRSD